jgi:hypothetical protein
MAAKKVFISSAHEDYAAMRELVKFLTPLVRRGEITIWTEDKLPPGSDTLETTLYELETSDLVLFLVSSDLIYSDFINDKIIPLTFQLREANKIRFIPILISRCSYDLSLFRGIMFSPTNGMPISAFPDKSEAWHFVIQDVLKVLLDIDSLTSNTTNLFPTNINSPVIIANPVISKPPTVPLIPKLSKVPRVKSSKLKILMLTANTGDRARLNIEKEHSSIAHKLSSKPDKFLLNLKKSVNINEFKEYTEEIKPNVLHFSGHAESGKGGIILHNEDKSGSEDLTPDGLDGLFEYFIEDSVPLHLVVLNACYTQEYALVIAKYVPYVVCTTVEIGDEQSIAFSTGFYYKLVETNNIEKAYKSGRTEAITKGAKKIHFSIYKDLKKLDI